MPNEPIAPGRGRSKAEPSVPEQGASQLPVPGHGGLEARLQEADGRYFWLFEDSPLAKYICDADGKLKEVNPALCRLLGRAPEDLIGQTMAGFSTDPPLALTELEDFLEGRARTFSSLRHYRAPGGWALPVRVTLGAVRDGSGRARTILGEVEDLTAEHLAGEEMDRQRRRLEMAIEASNIDIWELDMASGLVMVEERARAASGGRPRQGGDFGPGSMTYATFARKFHAEDRGYLPSLKELRAQPRLELDADLRLGGTPGPLRWVHLKGRAFPSEGGGVARVVGTIVDITEPRAARLRAERVLSQTLEASLDAFIGVDESGLVTDWNPAAEAMFGWFRNEVLGHELGGLICSPEGANALARLLADLEDPGRVGPEGPGLRSELGVKSRDGRFFPVEVSMVRIEDAGAPLFRLFVRDLSERKAYEDQLVRDALFDPLTGLPNRVLLVDRLGGAIGRLSRLAGLVAVLFIDVDRFKIVNDSLGRRAGDDFLVQLGHRLRAVLRPADTVARLGGDEFVVLCESLDGEREAMALAERVHGVLAGPFTLSGHHGQEIYASASVGVALADGAATSSEALVREAEIAMRRAKEQGGGRAEVFDAESQRRSIAHLETEAQLRRALERSELCVYYQPMVDLAGELREVEALVRWAHPSGRVALPTEFVPLAEETGLIVAVGELVLRMACEQAEQWRRGDPRLAKLGVSVNVSSAQLRRADAVERMVSIIEATGLPPSALTLEITESVLMDEKAGAGSKLAALRSLGVRLAIDDFGTGYSSLVYLRRYPLDILKIDRSFVAGLVDNPEDAAIVDAVVRLGHSLGLLTVAEGVETAEQLALLHNLRCDMGQGYLWGRPEPPEHLLDHVLGVPQ